MTNINFNRGVRFQAKNAGPGLVLGFLVLAAAVLSGIALFFTWLSMLAIGATDIGHPGYWQCLPLGILIALTRASKKDD